MTTQLDKLDLKILAELDENSRQTFSQIAKKVKTSKEVVRYRFEKLKENNILPNCYALISTYPLGYLIHTVWIKFHNTTDEIEQEIIQQLQKEDRVGVVIKTAGSWNFVFGIWAKDLIELNTAYKKITKNFSKYIKEQIISTEINCHYLSQSFIYKKTFPEVFVGDILKNVEIDSKDIIILKELAKDSRKPITEISEKIKLSTTAAINRIKRLEHEGIIAAYKIDINYEKLGLIHHRVFLKVTPSSREKITGYLRYKDKIISVMDYIGFGDIEFRICTKNIQEFYEEISDLKKKFGDEIKEYDSVIFITGFKVLNFLPM